MEYFTSTETLCVNLQDLETQLENVAAELNKVQSRGTQENTEMRAQLVELQSRYVSSAELDRTALNACLTKLTSALFLHSPLLYCDVG